MAYFEHRSTTRGHLEQLLRRRIHKAAPDEEGREALLAHLPRLLDELERRGLLDDRAWAESRLRRLRRQGHSERSIRAHLLRKRVPRALIDELLRERPVDPLLAALRYARRRRLGPFRHDGDEEACDKDLAKLGRAGFDYATARAVLALGLEEAEERLAEAR